MNKFLTKLSKERSRQGLYEFLDAEFSQFKSGENVLTIGSGGEINRLLYKHAEMNSFHVTSFDIDSHRNPDVQGDICTFDFGNTRFDHVAICEVLEHVHSPHLAINNIFSVLKSGGSLILTTPFMLPIHEAPIDYYRFTKYGLMHLLQNFDRVEVRERNNYFEAIDVFYMRILQTNHPRTNMVSWIVLPWVYYLGRIRTKLLYKLLPVRDMTTGYTVTAIKP